MSLADDSLTDVLPIDRKCPAVEETQLDRIERKLDSVLDISRKVEEMVTKVADQVKPVLDDLMKSPLLKMLGVKTK